MGVIMLVETVVAAIAGGMLGIVITVFGLFFALRGARKIASVHAGAGKMFHLSWLGFALLFFALVYFFPRGTVHPGGGYGILVWNMFLAWLGYASGLGVSALLALMALKLSLRKPSAPPGK
jgi:hypothetical protein